MLFWSANYTSIERYNPQSCCLLFSLLSFLSTLFLFFFHIPYITYVILTTFIQDIHMIVKLNVAKNVNTAVCFSKHNASLEKRVVVAGKYLIIQLKRYLLNDGGWVKDIGLVNCVMDQLSFSVDLDNEVQCRKSYHLVASICHSGTLAAVHYTAHVLRKQDSQWLLCNDKAVLPIQSSEVDNKYSYVLFYELS